MTALKTPPGKPGLPILGNFFDLKDRLLDFLEESARDYGDISHLRLVTNDIYLLNHPDFIQKVLIDDASNFTKDKPLKLLSRFVLGNGLLSSEGEEHKKQRKLSSPAFNRKNILSYAQAMIDITQNHSRKYKDRQVIDMHEEMMQAAAKIAAATLFNTRVDEDVEQIGQALTDVLEITEVLVSPIAEIVMALPFLPLTSKVSKGIKALDDIIYRFIDEHMVNPDQGDFLSILINAKQAQGIDIAKPAEKKQLRDEALTIFLAGHETTANALTFSWYLLSCNPKNYLFMLQEIDKVTQGGEIKPEHVNQLTYCRNVLAESMRLYPPAWAIGRVLKKDYAIGGYLLPANSEVWMSQYILHRDPRFYDEPLEFKPERWLPEEVEKRPRFSYFPFSAGPRNCIGEQFAWLEGTLILATLSQKFTFKALSKDVTLLPQVTLRPKDGMKMTISERK